MKRTLAVNLPQIDCRKGEKQVVYGKGLSPAQPPNSARAYNGADTGHRSFNGGGWTGVAPSSGFVGSIMPPLWAFARAASHHFNRMRPPGVAIRFRRALHGAGIVCVLVGLSLSLNVHGAFVTPKQDVTSNVAIRQTPTDDGTVVGRLDIGENAEVSGGTPGYHYVRIGHIVGFVAKDVVILVQQDIPATPPRAGPVPPPRVANLVKTFAHQVAGHLKANGADSATLLVELQAPAEGNFTIILSVVNGILEPDRIVIFEGETFGETKLTSIVVGEIAVTLHGVLTSGSGKTRTVRFYPPIEGIQFEARPRRIHLLENTKLQVKLLDANGNALVAEEHGIFSLQSGSGIFESDVDVHEGFGQAAFRPSSLGIIELEVDVPPYVVPATIEVVFPWVLTFSAILGGLIGGWFGPLKNESREKRLLLGMVTSLVLFWLIAIGAAVFATAHVLNPIGAFIIGIVGGWMGVGVFKMAQGMVVPGQGGGS